MKELNDAHVKSDSAHEDEARTLRIDSPIGALWLKSHGEALVQISFSPQMEQAEPSPVLRDAAEQLRAYFAGTLRQFDLPLMAEGTPFQRRVWQEVRRIGYGHTLSYQAIADRLAGSAARAVGHANATNPLPIIVPCHRVLGHRGQLTGYLGGLERKRWLLQHEGALTTDLFTAS